MDFGALELTLAAVAVFAGGLVQGVVGFGLALVSVPPLLMIGFGQSTIVPVIVLMGTVNALLLLYHTRQGVSAQMLVPLVVGAIIGVPIGGFLLASVDTPAFKIFVGIVIIATSILLLSGWRKSYGDSFLHRIPVGLASGFLGGSIALGGPPIVLFLSNEGVSRDAFRGSLAAYFVMLNIVAITSFAILGLFSTKVFTYAASGVVPLVLGTFTGIWVGHRLPEPIFARAALILVGLMGVALMASNV